MAGDFFGWHPDGIRMDLHQFCPCHPKSHPSAAAHQLTTRKFATFASNLEKVALRSPGTKVHVEFLSSEFLKFQRVFEGLSNVGFGPRARAIFMSSSLTLTQESFKFAISDGKITIQPMLKSDSICLTSSEIFYLPIRYSQMSINLRARLV